VAVLEKEGEEKKKKKITGSTEATEFFVPF